MNAGGLAQMSSFSNVSGGDFSVPTGFTSRRGSTIKSLSFDQSRIAGTLKNSTPTPRTSRSHLLAGLRTAPRNSVNYHPLTAPPTQLEHNIVVGSRFPGDCLKYDSLRTSNLLGQQISLGQVCNNQCYSSPEHILAPPEIQVDEPGYEQMDPNYYAQLVATNMYLAEQQQRLQQQLINVQAAAQQFQGMSLALPQYSMPMTTSPSIYQQQVKHNIQIPHSSGSGATHPLSSCYNTSTGQNTYIQIDQQRSQLEQLQAVHSLANLSHSRSNMSPRLRASMMTTDLGLQILNGNSSTKPQSPTFDPAPLPPPSAGAFRRGHRKSPSLGLAPEENLLDIQKVTAMSKMGGVPTPGLAGFGPGQGRIGEHPIRQPRGPPSIDVLINRPTSKYEGAKNFATRARRSAVNNLVRAGIERRKAPDSVGSGSITPDSEVGDVPFSLTDNDSDSGHSGSGSLSSRPALGSPRTSIHGAIGSNRPSSRQKVRNLERKSITSLDSNFTSASVSGDEASLLGGNFAAVVKNGRKNPQTVDAELKAPKLILTPVDNFKNLL